MINSIKIFFLLFLFPSLLFAQYSDWKAEQFKSPVKKQTLLTYSATNLSGDVEKEDLTYKLVGHYSNKGLLIKTKGINISFSDTTVTSYFYRGSKLLFTKAISKSPDGEFITYEVITNWEPNGAPKNKYGTSNKSIELEYTPKEIKDSCEITYRKRKISSVRRNVGRHTIVIENTYDKLGNYSKSATVIYAENDTTSYTNIFNHFPANKRNWEVQIIESDDWLSYVERELVLYDKKELKGEDNTPQYNILDLDVPDIELSKMRSKDYYGSNEADMYWNYITCLAIAEGYDYEGYSVEGLFGVAFTSFMEHKYYAIIPTLVGLMNQQNDKMEDPLMGQAYAAYFNYQGYFNLKQFDSASIYLDKFSVLQNKLMKENPDGRFSGNIDRGYKMGINTAIINYELGKIEEARRALKS